MGSGLNFVTDGEVFRKDNRLILAINRHQAAIVPVQLKYEAGGYYAGQVLARNTTSGVHCKYASGGSSGTDTAVGVLFNDVLDMTASVDDVGQMIAKGNVFYANCIDVDADAVTDLKGRVVVDGNRTSILMF